MEGERNVSIDVLWRQFQQNKTKELRDRIIEYYLPLVNVIAGRLAISLPSHVDKDDLVSSGFFGLMDAVSRYDYARGNKFETYAGVRIRGAMLDYLRSKDWISVSLRQKIKNYEKTVGALEGRLGRSATDQEIAAEMNITIEQLYTLEKQLNVSTVMPLEEYVKAEQGGGSGIEDPSSSVEAVELKETLAAAIDQLPEKERTVVSLYYYDELTMKEISLILHLSEARICQLHTKAVLRMRGFLANVSMG